jgi:uncharacterized protein (DUF2236 family)
MQHELSKMPHSAKEPPTMAVSASTALSKEALLSPDFDPKHMRLIIQEGILIGAGAATILLQVAEPGVGQGVNEYSNFAYRPQDRLRTTMTFVYCMTHGTPAEKRAIIDMVNRIHGSVNGTLDDGRGRGRRFDANDPELQLWVAATLYAVGIETYRRVFGEVGDDALKDEIYREYSILATSLRVPAEMWPPNRAAFREYWDRKVETLEVTEHARSVARDLLYLPRAPWYMRMFMPTFRIVTAELLPEKLRNAYGINYRPRMAQLVLLLTKAIYRPLPLSWRTWPVRVYMQGMRKRLERAGKVFDKAH